MSQLHLHRLSLPQSCFRFKFPPLPSLNRHRVELNSARASFFYPLVVAKSRIACRFSKYITPQFEVEKGEDKQKPEKRANEIFWIILINLGIYVADHFFQVRDINSLYLYHSFPEYQFVIATFCHANWNHLSINLFFMYMFGKLVEEEGNLGLWLSYLFTGVGANVVYWLVLPRNAASIGA